ncbi:coiled-coil domain-containing protein 24 [Discoglossus pictus]
MQQPVNDQDSGYGEIIEPPPSLWRLVEDQVPVSERAEIKRILGDAAVDLSLDLHAEIEVLLDLWRDLRSSCPSSSRSSFHSTCSLLADPPAIKDMITQEIGMLLLAVRRKARRDGLNDDQAICKYNPRIVSFVLGTERPESSVRQPSSARSRDCAASGDERPLSSLSTGSNIEDDLEELKQKLKISDIDEVVTHLQSLLEDECKSLEKDIAFLQQRLEEEHLYESEPLILLAEPSLAELKEERRVIEKDLHLNQPTVISGVSHKIAKTPKSSRPMDDSLRNLPKNQQTWASNLRPVSCSLQDGEPKLIPCPPHSKAKAQWMKNNNAVTSPCPPNVLCKTKDEKKLEGMMEHQIMDATNSIGFHRRFTTSSTSPNQDPIPNTFTSLHDLQKNPPPVLDINPSEVSPSVYVSSEHIQTVPKLRPMPKIFDSFLIPAPPPAQRPSSSSKSHHTFRRVRAQHPNPSS